MLSNLTFTLPEILSLLGLSQCIYVLVYMLLRSGSLMNAVIPSLYFGILGAAFFFDVAAGRWFEDGRGIESLQWLIWFSGVPLGVLLIVQILRVPLPPPPRYLLLLLFIPLTFLPKYFFGDESFMYVAGLVTGALSLLAVWLRRDLMNGLYRQARFGGERFWLALSLITLNVAFLAFTAVFMDEGIHSPEWVLVRSILGIAFVYIAGTSLFRIYPQALKKDEKYFGALTGADKDILNQIQKLFDIEKIYQDSSFGRAELARELDVGEAVLSRVINQSYGKTIPQLLNDYRVRDAQKLLRETDASIQTVFEESGFSSITTFNRVFKDVCGETPTTYREKRPI